MKVNTVIRAGYNEHSVEKVAEDLLEPMLLCVTSNSWMLGETNSWNNDEVITGEMMREMLDNLQPINRITLEKLLIDTKEVLKRSVSLKVFQSHSVVIVIVQNKRRWFSIHMLVRI